ncbi:hypothetical protein FHP05_00065 [Cerasibacillus terrae]|uniref:RiboL-PSP-HEPN domain-containing protein n=1 Tax=Cerasibacillus terrae TaxID=2498845 RepID=A0A5C8P211_9BACI|nr:hypothetical protein [Cerasibacillus terrae]TXL67458.1 hypothetical protein FHP05_00065 [Cerasibacillus terrae]
MEWYEINLDSQKVLKKIIKKNPEIIPLQSVLVAKELKETTKLLETSIVELNDLTVVSLVSIFEQTLIGHLKNLIYSQFEPKNELNKRISDYTIEHAERGRFTEIIELFKPQVDSELIGMVKQVYTYRNWVAHGKLGDAPAKIDPISAYERLSDFLNKVL